MLGEVPGERELQRKERNKLLALAITMAAATDGTILRKVEVVFCFYDRAVALVINRPLVLRLFVRQRYGLRFKEISDVSATTFPVPGYRTFCIR